MKFCKFSILVFICLLFLGRGQVVASDSETINKMNKIIEKLEKRIEVLEDKIKKYEKKGTSITQTEARKAVKEELAGKAHEAPGIHEKEKEGWFGTAAVSYVQIGGIDDIDYAVSEHPDDSEGQKGDMHSIEFGWVPAYNAGFGYRFSGGNELALSGWWLNTNESDDVRDNDDLMSVLLHSENDDADGIDKAEAEMDVDMMRFGLDFTSPFYQGEITRMTWSAGIRYMNIRQHLKVDYYDDGALEAFIDAKIHNDLYGARLGMGGEFMVPLNILKRTLSVNTDLGVSLFASHTTLDQLEGPISDVDAPIDIHDKQSNVVPAIDLSLGLIWRPYKPFSLALNYDFMWLNDVFTLHQGLDDTSHGQSRQWEEDITLHGVTLEGTYTF